MLNTVFLTRFLAKGPFQSMQTFLVVGSMLQSSPSAFAHFSACEIHTRLFLFLFREIMTRFLCIQYQDSREE